MGNTARRADDGPGEIITADEYWQLPPPADGTKHELVDGRLRAMSPASDTHGMIQATCARLIGNHVAAMGGRCRVVAEPAIAVRVRSRLNRRVPDIGVTCTPSAAGLLEMPDPVLLIEILSAGNKEDTWDNVWSYTTVPSIRDILVLSSFGRDAHLLSRDGDGHWPEDATRLIVGDTITLASIDFSCRLEDFYAGTYLSTG